MPVRAAPKTAGTVALRGGHHHWTGMRSARCCVRAMLVSSFLLDVPCRRARPAWLARPTVHPAPSAPPSERTAAKIAARWLWVVGVGEELRQTPNRPALRCGAVLWAIGHEAG